VQDTGKTRRGGGGACKLSGEPAGTAQPLSWWARAGRTIRPGSGFPDGKRQNWWARAVVSSKNARKAQQRQQARPAAVGGRAHAGAAGGGSGPAGQPRPLPGGRSLVTPGTRAAPGRQPLERRSAVMLLWLHQLPVWVLPVVLVVFLAIGVSVGGVIGAIALAVVAAVLLWLAALSWPRLGPAARLIRVLTVAVVLGLAVLRMLNRKL
jgi:hypothetical protein